MKRFDYKETPTEAYGLKFRPTVSERFDNMDFSQTGIIDGQEVDLSEKHNLIKVEFSDLNKSVLVDVMNDLNSKGTLNSILEIGVYRSHGASSTSVILSEKPWETKYFGIDLLERHLAPIRNHGLNVFCFHENSSNAVSIMEKCKERGVEKFDLVLIDGNHSINQVMDDWRFAEYVNPGGCVLMHDTNYHPGPYCVYEAIDEKLFDKKKFAEEEALDWGISLARKK